MITMKIKSMFFDRQAVIKKAGIARVRVLSKVGAFVRKRMQTSMRYRKGPSKPGTPPSAHKTSVGPLLRKLIFFGYDPSTESVVIGPVRARGGEAPRLNEFGGKAKRGGRTVAYPKRSFAEPALRAEEPKLPSYWQNTIRGDT